MRIAMFRAGWIFLAFPGVLLVCVSGALSADGRLYSVPAETACAIPDPFDADQFQDTRIIVPPAWREVIVEVYSEGASFLVRLEDSEPEPGEHLWRWNGCDDEGRALSPGVYFLRILYIIGENTESCVFPLRLLRSASSSGFHK